MTEWELAEIEARAQAATVGPWETKRAAIGTDVGIVAAIHGSRHVLAEVWSQVDALPPDEQRAFSDARFIAHARADVPKLVAEVRRLRAELERGSDGQSGE